MSKPNLVDVVWIDSAGCGEWTHLSDIDRIIPVQIRSVGWVVRETDEFVVVTGHASVELNHEAQCSGAMAIPRVAIQSMRDIELRSVKKRKKQRGGKD